MNKKLIIFDMDGTLYKIKEGSFNKSRFNKKMLSNAEKYIADKQGVSLEKGKQILDKIFQKYNGELSIAIEKEFNGDRYDYFNTVWNIDAKDFIQENVELKALLKRLKERYILVVVSDAPAIWTENVLKELGVYELFEGNIFDGTGNERKVNGNGFDRVLKKFGVQGEDVISIGDQENTDIIPAKKLGMTTVYVGAENSKEADYNIKDVFELESILQVNLEEVLRKYFKDNNINVESIKKLNGSSDAKAFLCDNEVYKIGPSKVILDEVKTFERFKNRMKSYTSVFPEMKVVSKEEITILWIENCGKENLEVVYKDLSKDFELLKGINKQVLEKIRILFQETQNDESGGLFFEELISVLKLNLQKAELWPEYESVVKKIESKREGYLKNFVSSIAHKDLSVGNILVSDDNQQVRFIDPRLAVPYLEESQASGNVVIDLMGYYVSFMRKEMEVKRDNSNLNFLEINSDIEKEIQEYQEKGVFTGGMRNLALAIWYSVYAACKCDYCTAPERVWLYDEMVNRLRKTLDEL